jgi:hypothetical protein
MFWSTLTTSTDNLSRSIQYFWPLRTTHKLRRMRWVGHVAHKGERRGVYRVLVGKSGGKRPLGRPRCRWEDNINMDLQEVGCGGMDWIELAQDRDRWGALVNVVMNQPPNSLYALGSVPSQFTVCTWQCTFSVHCMHLAVYLLSSLYSTPVCRFRLMSYDLSPTTLTEVAQRGNIVTPWGWHCFSETYRSHCINK